MDDERSSRLRDAITAHEDAMQFFEEENDSALLEALNPSVAEAETSHRTLNVIRSLQLISDILDEESVAEVFNCRDNLVLREALDILSASLLLHMVMSAHTKGQTRVFRYLLSLQFPNETVRKLKASSAQRAEFDA